MNRSAKTPTITTRPSRGQSQKVKERSPSPDVDFDIRPEISRRRNSNPPKVKLKLKGRNNDDPALTDNSNSSIRGIRRSPRRQKPATTTTQEDQVKKPISLQGLKNIEPKPSVVITPSNLTFTSYRIPKKATNGDMDNINGKIQPSATPTNESSGGYISKSQGHPKTIFSMKTTPTPDPRNSSLASTSNAKSSNNAHKNTSLTASALANKDGKDKTVVDKPLSNALRDNTQQTSRPIILQAKRRLPNQQKVNVTDKGMSNTSKDTLKNMKTFNETFEDLPDYEDSVLEVEDEEVAESSNPMHGILKMVKDNSNMTASRPQNSVIPEVTAMDVDIDLPQSQPVPSERIIIVPDTNIWINDLGLIETLMNKEFSKPILVIIPWMVLQELDVGFHQKAGQSLAKMKKPIKYIHSLLASKNPRIQGQKAYEAAISKLTFDELVADDSILNCVFQNLQNNNGNNTVMFLTNDTNLLNKALVNGIIAANAGSALKTLSEVLTNKTCTTPLAVPTATASVLVSAENNTPQNSSNWPMKRRFDSADSGCDNNYILDNDVEMQEDYETSPPLCKVRAVAGQQFSSGKPENEFQAIETALLKAFSYIIRRKMIEDYGMGGWEYALKIKPPWSLANAVKCMIVHWIANFSYVFTRRGQAHLEKLKQLIDQYKSSRVTNQNDIEEQIIDSSISLFNFLDKELEKDETVIECKRLLLTHSARSQKLDTRHSFG